MEISSWLNLILVVISCESFHFVKTRMLNPMVEEITGVGVYLSPVEREINTDKLSIIQILNCFLSPHTLLPSRIHIFTTLQRLT